VIALDGLISRSKSRKFSPVSLLKKYVYLAGNIYFGRLSWHARGSCIVLVFNGKPVGFRRDSTSFGLSMAFRGLGI
jgi:hypothetical protein